jgi:hypothetical protein
VWTCAIVNLPCATSTPFLETSSGRVASRAVIGLSEKDRNESSDAARSLGSRARDEWLACR